MFARIFTFVFIFFSFVYKFDLQMPSIPPPIVPPITMIFGGDCTFSDWYEVNTKLDEIEGTFEGIEWIKDADITMVNLESCISNRGTKLPKKFNFRMKPTYLPVLNYAGIDIVNLANNHVVDYGLVGMKDTFHYLDSLNIKYVGAGLNLESARKPVVFDVRGVRIGFLGYSFAFGASDESFGTAPINKDIIKEDLENLKQNEKADYIVVNFHWGKEGSHFANDEQKDIARFSIDNGADIVVGHHPHVLQGFEEYKSRYIVYSLGNFIFGGNSRKQHYTMLFKVTIQDKTLIPELIPIFVNNFRAYEVSSEKRDSIIKLVEEYSNPSKKVNSKKRKKV